MNLAITTKMEMSDAGRFGVFLMIVASLAGPFSSAILIGSLTRYGSGSDGAFFTSVCSPCVFVIGALLFYFGRRFEHTVKRTDD